MTLPEDCSLSRRSNDVGAGVRSIYTVAVARTRARRWDTPIRGPESGRARATKKPSDHSSLRQQETDRPTGRFNPRELLPSALRIDSLSATRQTCSTFFPSLSPCLSDWRSFEKLGSLPPRRLRSRESVLVLEEKYWVHRVVLNRPTTDCLPRQRRKSRLMRLYRAGNSSVPRHARLPWGSHPERFATPASEINRDLLRKSAR